MEYDKVSPEGVHMGRNIAKFRHLKGFKKQTFAPMIGLHDQQELSKLESTRNIDVMMLEKIAPLLGVSVEVLQNMPEDAGNIIIENTTFEEGSAVNVGNNNDNENHINIYNTNNPIDEIVALMREKENKEQERVDALQKRIMELEELIRSIKKD